MLDHFLTQRFSSMRSEMEEVELFLVSCYAIYASPNKIDCCRKLSCFLNAQTPLTTFFYSALFSREGGWYDLRNASYYFMVVMKFNYFIWIDGGLSLSPLSASKKVLVTICNEKYVFSFRDIWSHSHSHKSQKMWMRLWWECEFFSFRGAPVFPRTEQKYGSEQTCIIQYSSSNCGLSTRELTTLQGVTGKIDYGKGPHEKKRFLPPFSMCLS